MAYADSCRETIICLTLKRLNLNVIEQARNCLTVGVSAINLANDGMPRAVCCAFLNRWVSAPGFSASSKYITMC